MVKASFGAGCFWGVEEAFRKVPGVLSTEVGYSGGTSENPTYHQVCTGTTGHAETLSLDYDPAKIAYEQLLDLFWKLHDPTTRDRQGPDIGSQYRSVVFYYTPEQHQAAQLKKQQLDDSGHYRKPIVTQIVPAAPFYRAEEYHQRYVEKQGGDSCHF